MLVLFLRIIFLDFIIFCNFFRPSIMYLAVGAEVKSFLCQVLRLPGQDLVFILFLLQLQMPEAQLPLVTVFCLVCCLRTSLRSLLRHSLCISALSPVMICCYLGALFFCKVQEKGSFLYSYTSESFSGLSLCP